ncbi:NAD-dependent epimerase/dehydratase family protein [Rhodovastum atsumiense]|uniref:NAD-dependent epimerase/dehydratase family protein n=1 Tax=Rhodovastum atsumiense TaxID=504468 RepID=A0A5M6IPN8_9PROT|nr:GDP-mannose 4,6-dehydratase [Rhodovastum atsumiense]KAA5610196.1 NAD-dependent epimerase/dehydratase family protein [Rhodovastum atsumiense]CAH2604190.1 NAD-dependent epimerase/dehydratase family protein [Rhodovastum atsumiense]
MSPAVPPGRLLHRILVTGAGGFVATHLVPQLRAAFPTAELTLCGGAPGMTPLDVTDAAAVEALVARLRPDACVHLAAISAVPAARQHPAQAWQVNLHGTLALAGAVLRHTPDCTFLYASSADIYGRSFRAGTPLNETAVPAPTNVYGASKAAADLALGAMAAEGLRVVRLRPFNHTGPGQSAAFVVPAFARQVMRIAAGMQAPVLQVGALDPFRDFLDVRDVCAAYVACLERRDSLEPGLILNIAAGAPRRVGDVLADLLHLAEVEARPETGAALLRPADIPVACGDPRLARRVLGWAPVIPWERTLRDVLADWRLRVQDELVPG